MKFVYKWVNHCPYLYAHEIDDLRTLKKSEIWDKINVQKIDKNVLFKILDSYRERIREQITDSKVFEVCEARRADCELRHHEREGHLHFRPDCPGCRHASARSRPRRRLPETLRPGGELSVDISGPHTSGRWPSDAQESYSKRAMYFLVGALKTYN